MNAAPTGGPGLPQERRLVTEIPGPESAAAARPQEGVRRRRRRHHAAGLRRGRRRRRARRRRRQLADRPRLGHRGDHASATPPPRWSRGCSEQVAAFTHTCFMVTPYDGYVDVCEALAELTPGDHAKKSALFNSGAEAVENAVKIARSHTGRDAVGGLRPRLPRPHQPHDGDDRQEHAVQAPLRAVRRRGLPRADVLPVPRRADRRGGRRPGDRRPRQAGRRRQPRRRRDRADPGRGRLRRARPTGFLPALADWAARATASSSSPTRSSPASAAPATGSPATTRASCPTWSPPPRASPAACRWPAVTGRAEHHGRRPRRRPRRHLRRQPGRLRRRARLDRGDEEHDLAGPGPRRSGSSCAPGCATLADEHPVIGDIRGRGAMMAIELCEPGTTTPDAARAAAVNAYCHRRAWSR